MLNIFLLYNFVLYFNNFFTIWVFVSEKLLLFNDCSEWTTILETLPLIPAIIPAALAAHSVMKRKVSTTWIFACLVSTWKITWISIVKSGWMTCRRHWTIMIAISHYNERINNKKLLQHYKRLRYEMKPINLSLESNKVYLSS